MVRERRLSDQSQVVQMRFKIGIAEQRFKLVACSFAPQLQRFLNLLLFLASVSVETIEHILMYFAVTQFPGRFAQLVEELHRGLLVRIELGMNDFLPSLKTAQTGAKEMSGLRAVTLT